MIDHQKIYDTFINPYGKELAAEVIDMFILQFNEQFFNDLRNDVWERNYLHLEPNAHDLKGVIGMFGDPLTTTISKKFLGMVQDNTGLQLNETFDELEHHSMLLIAELKIIRQDLTS